MNTNRYIKIILPVSIVIAVGLLLIIRSITGDDFSKSLYTPEQQSKVSIPEDKTEDEEPSQEVSMPNSPTEKYILQYDSQSNSVMLITKKEDGTEIISSVDSINPYYLTDEDIKLLTAGIELTSREDMFILIEDFSS